MPLHGHFLVVALRLRCVRRELAHACLNGLAGNVIREIEIIRVFFAHAIVAGALAAPCALEGVSDKLLAWRSEG